MAINEPLKTQLHGKLNDFSSLTRMLLEMISTDKPSFSTSVPTSTPPTTTGTTDESVTSVLDKLIERDREMQELVETALKMRTRQREIDWIDSQLELRKNEIEELQNRLHDAEKLLELTVHHGKQKLDSIEQSKKGSVCPEKLIAYAHKISQASSAISPVGWQPIFLRLVHLASMDYFVAQRSTYSALSGDPRRPYPQDIEMRSGALGKLNPDVSSIKELESSGENLTLELNGLNQNNNNTKSTLTNDPSQYVSSLPQQVHNDPEPMSEDTSSSSSDEDNTH